MDTILYSDIIRKPVELPNKKAKSKLVEIVAYQGERHWYAEEVMIESGFIDKEGAYYPVSAVKDIGGDGAILLKPKRPGKFDPKKTDSFILSTLLKKMVVDNSGEELGRVYDFEIYIGRTPWIVWKIMVNPTGLKPTKKRLRVPSDNVSEMTANKIILK
ncbi:MAG: hypothetical protein R6U17_02825 [Thermoplasmata archaeon]